MLCRGVFRLHLFCCGGIQLCPCGIWPRPGLLPCRQYLYLALAAGRLVSWSGVRLTTVPCPGVFLPGGAWGADEVVDGPFHGQKPLVCLLHPHYPRWRSGQGVRGHSPGRSTSDESHSAVPREGDVHHGGPGAPSLAQPGRDEGRRQGTLSWGPHLPGRAVRRHRRGLCPAVLAVTAADRGDPAHLPRRDTPSTAAPGARPHSTRHRGRPPASSRAAPPQAESILRPARLASRRRAAPPASQQRPQVAQEVDKAALTRATRRCWNWLFLRRRREQRRSFPRWRAGRRIFRSVPPLVQGPLSPTTHFASSQERTVRGRHSSPRTSG